MNCQNPLDRRFWLGSVDPRPLALFRVLIGLTVLHDLLDGCVDFRAFFTDDGFLPRSVARPFWAWSLFDLAGGPAACWAIYALGFVIFAAFTLGYRTRIATVLAWAWLLSLHHRNPFVTDGGDDLIGILLFWSMFSDLGACWSIDAQRRPPRAAVPALGLRLLQAHVAVLYYATARLKLMRGWLHGTAIFQTLQLIGFVRPLGSWLGTQPALCSALTYLVLVMEAAFPFAAFSPIWIVPARFVALGLGLAIQLGIASVMRAGIFQEAMLSSCALFILPEWFDAGFAWASRHLGVTLVTPPRGGESAVPEPSKTTRRPARSEALACLLGLQFFCSVWGFFGARRIPLPRFVSRELSFLSLEQPADLFGTIYSVPTWVGPGQLSDGSSVDVLAVVEPEIHPLEPGIRHSRWNKFIYKEDIPWPTLGPYICRTYAERRPTPPLVSFEVIDAAIKPHLPGQPANPPQNHTLWRQRCE